MKTPKTKLPSFMMEVGALVTAAFGFWRFFVPVPAPPESSASESESGPPAESGPLGDPGLTRNDPLDSKDLSPSERVLQSPTAVECLRPSTPFLSALVEVVKSGRSGPDPSSEEETELERWIGGISPDKFPLALDYLADHDCGEEGRALSLRLVKSWADRDPRAAAAWASICPQDALRLEALQAVAAAWAAWNLNDAVAWARLLTAEGDRSGGLIALAYEAARNQPMDALRLVVDLPADEARDGLIAHAVSQWAGSTPADAAEWADSIPDPDLRENLLSVIAAAWGESDPLSAATLAVHALPPGKRQDDAVVGIVERWVQSDPEAAAAWVAEFPEGKLRLEAVQHLVLIWADLDVNQAGRWVAGLEQGTSRDLAIATYAAKIAPAFPAVAAQWAENIDGESVRARALEAVGQAWLQSDAPAARAWLAAIPLSGDAKERLQPSVEGP